MLLEIITVNQIKEYEHATFILDKQFMIFDKNSKDWFRNCIT